MKSDYEQFAEALRSVSAGKLKPVPILPEGHPMQALIDMITGSTAGTLQDVRERTRKIKRREIPDVIGGVIDEGTIDALAISHNNKYFIGINWSIVLFMMSVFHRLLAHREVLPWVGNSSGEAKSPRFDPLTLPTELHPPNILEFSRNVEYPIDPIRKQMANHLAQMAYGVVLFHEFRHILGGHLDYLSARLPKLAIQERISLSLTGSQARQFQALERDADSAAFVAEFSNFKGWHDGVHQDSPESRVLVPDLPSVIECTFLVVDTVFKILTLDDPDDPVEWATADHPPGPVRRLLIADDAFRFIAAKEELRGLEELARREIIPRVFGISETLTGPFFGRPVGRSPWEDDRPEVLAHRDRILAWRREIEADLATHRFYDFGFDGRG